MHILFCASEAAPIVKIGGLGDVAGSLPKALEEIGITSTVVIPHYATIDSATWHIEQVGEFVVPFAGKEEIVTLSRTTLPKSSVTVYLLGNRSYFAGGGLHAFEGSASESDRFAFFSKAIVAMIVQDAMPSVTKATERQVANLRKLIVEPDVVHINDWHGSMIPILYKHMAGTTQTSGARPAFVLTIHNLAYQGITSLDILDKLGIKASIDESVTWDAANNDIDMLMEGIIHADVINTVSENYTHEIVTPEFSEGLGEILQRRQDRLFGILNGIDYETWNPATDSRIKTTYQKGTLKESKPINKQALQSLVGLPQGDLPVIGFIGRVEPKQKGIDLMYDWLSNAATSLHPFQFILLGTGDKLWEEKLAAFAVQKENWISINLKFDETIAHAMYAGCDYLVMPSKFEPGGLPQMIGQHYGTVPIVHGVGGLKDTVQDDETGFVFPEYSAQALANSVERALKIYGTDTYWQMAERGMEQDYSWRRSATKYKDLYEKAVSLAKT